TNDTADTASRLSSQLQLPKFARTDLLAPADRRSHGGTAQGFLEGSVCLARRARSNHDRTSQFQPQLGGGGRIEATLAVDDNECIPFLGNLFCQEQSQAPNTRSLCGRK